MKSLAKKEPSPTSMWGYTDAKKAQFISAIMAEIRTQDTKSEPGVEFRKELPELYQYEDYPIVAQYLIYMAASALNTALFAAWFAKGMFTVPQVFLHSIEVALLNYATDGRYQHHASESVTRLFKKLKVQLEMSGVDGMSDEEIKLAFDKLTLTGKANQRAHLEKMSVDTTKLTEHETTQLFRRLYLYNRMDELLMVHPSIQSNMDIRSINIALKDKDKLSDEKIYEILMKLDNKIVNGAYVALRLAEKDMDSQLIEVLRVLFLYPAGMKHANAIMCALQDAWKADASVMKRCMQAFAFILALPLIALKLTWDSFSAVYDSICVGLKMLTVGLINAPLNVRNYFYPKAEVPEATKPKDRLQKKENARVLNTENPFKAPAPEIPETNQDSTSYPGFFTSFVNEDKLDDKNDLVAEADNDDEFVFRDEDGHWFDDDKVDDMGCFPRSK